MVFLLTTLYAGHTKSVLASARASREAARRGRLCFDFSTQPAPVDGSVNVSFRVGSSLWFGEGILVDFERVFW